MEKGCSAAEDRRFKLAFVGGGSLNWGPGLIRDIMMIEIIAGIDFFLLDKDLKRAEKMKRLGLMMNEALKTFHTFTATDREEEAFDGCDFVIICISTGGLRAMRHDLAIPEKYGIYATVGDTTGPGGWSRNLRNVPVFNALADQIARYSNDAVVLNYTNPLACLTKAFYARTNLRTVGLCHGVYENYQILMSIFGLKSEKQLNVRFGGVNHFFWMLDIRVDGKDGYALLREKLKGGRRFADLAGKKVEDGSGFSSGKELASELFETFGYLPYFGDRHTCEFLPWPLRSEETLARYGIRRTTIEERERMLREKEEILARLLCGKEQMEFVRSREAAADIIEAIALGKTIVDVVNVPNIGQIPNLPRGAVVETLGTINALGFTPLAAGPLPEPLLRLVRPHAENSEIIYQAAAEGDFELALEALYNDPSCSHLPYADIRRMGLELLEANREYLPQFR